MPTNEPDITIISLTHKPGATHRPSRQPWVLGRYRTGRPCKIHLSAAMPAVATFPQDIDPYRPAPPLAWHLDTTWPDGERIRRAFARTEVETRQTPRGEFQRTHLWAATPTVGDDLEDH